MGDIDIEEIKEVFRRINATSYSLNAMEINNARYDGEFKNFVFNLAENIFFQNNKVFSNSDARRMNDVKFCIGLVISILSSYPNRDDEHEKYLEIYNDAFNEGKELSTQLDLVFKHIDECKFSSSDRVFKKADLFTLIVEMHRVLFKEKYRLNITKLKKNLINFYNKVELSKKDEGADSEYIAYYRATLQASNDRSSRIIRGEIIHRVLMESLE